MLNLPPDEIHLWHLDDSDGGDADVSHAILGLLDAAEQARMTRFSSKHLRREFAATRAMCRIVLSRYVPTVAARAWSFRSNEWGRPRALLPPGAPDIDFNITHSCGVIAMAVALASRRIGTDLEAIDAARVEPGIARRFFSSAECAALEALPDADRVDRFFELWSTKEAYVKARGHGLSIPLDTFSVEIVDAVGEGGRHAYLAAAPPDDDLRLWRLLLSDFPPRHKLALCARLATPGEALRLRYFEFRLPL